MPVISVIVPVYKVEPYLSRCVDSVLAQTFPDFELILVDDGSPDNSPAICDEYARMDSRISVIHQENQGQAAARNRALLEARGEWISFVDSDDLIHPQTLEFLYRAVRDGNYRIGMCNPIESDQVSNDFTKSYPFSYSGISINEETLEMLYDDKQKYYWVVWAKIIDRKLILDMLFSPGRVYEDNAIVCQWLVAAKDIAVVDLPLYFYQVNAQGTTKSQFSLRHLDYLWALEQQVFFYGRTNMQGMGLKVFSDYISTAHAYYDSVRFGLGNAKASRKIRKNLSCTYKQIRRKLSVPHSLRLRVYQIAHPKVMNSYWLLKRLVAIVKEQGVAKAVQRIIKRICGGRI